MSAKTIIVTRPSGQARQLIEVLTSSIELSGVAKCSLPEILSLPLLTIVPKTDEALAAHIASLLQDADLAIFVSPNAIECVMRLLERNWQNFSKRIIPIGVMGGSSRVALQHHGVGAEVNPTPIVMPQDKEHGTLRVYGRSYKAWGPIGRVREFLSSRVREGAIGWPIL